MRKNISANVMLFLYNSIYLVLFGLVVDEAKKYQKERNQIIVENRELHIQVDNIKKEYEEKEIDLDR